jgi:hypothetical protein
MKPLYITGADDLCGRQPVAGVASTKHPIPAAPRVAHSTPAASVPMRMENRSALPLDGALTPAQVKRLSQWGITRQKAVKRSWQGVCSPRAAIKVQCLDCCGEDERAITECGDRCCPLWHFRPFQRRGAA